MILWQIALRNLWLHKFKTLIVGGIMFIGTALVVVGNAALDRFDATTSIAIVNSLSGHAHIYNGSSVDDFVIFRGFDSSTRQIDPIEDFARTREALESLDGVRRVVPMGMDYAVVFTGNILDRKLSALREALDDADGAAAGVTLAHVKRIVRVLREQIANLSQIADMDLVEKRGEADFEALEQTKDDDFWRRWEQAPYEVLEFLENKVAKLAMGEDLIWVQYIGADTEAFRETFDRFQLEDGEMIPPGKRGFMFNKLKYERHFKNKTARRLDKTKDRLDNGEAFDACDDCKTWAAQNVRQAASLVYQLDDPSAEAATRALQAHLGSKETDLVALLKEFLDMDQDTFQARYDLFYEVIAPRIVLYTVDIGDTLVLTSFNSGYIRKVPVKVYGTFRFDGLDKSPIAGSFNLADLMTFRELYGHMTDERKAEIEALQKEAGVADVSDDEEDLFGGDSELVDDAEAKAFDATDGLDLKAGGITYTADAFDKVHSPEEIEGGVVLHAAVMFEDGVDMEATMAALEAKNEEAGLGLKIISWRTAAGFVGQFIDVIRMAMYAFVFIIFVVALVIINNSVMMSTMERTVEIGTMRAVGAQRSFVRSMMLIETGVMAVIFGGGGVLAGSATVVIAKIVGVPAWNDVTFFIFAGPRFRPELMWHHLVIALVVIAIVSIGSTLYPAIIATRVTPREAMAAAED